MKKRSLKLTLTTCTALAILSLGGATALADEQVTTPSEPVSVSNKNLDQQETVSREITVVSPENGEETVINQVANRVTQGESDHSNVWLEYFPPFYEGYRPSELTIPPVVVKENTKPEKIKITYQPLSPSDIQTARVAIVLADIDGKEPDKLRLTKCDQNGYVDLPTLDDGWEYVNKSGLPDKIHFFMHGNVHSIRIMIQKKGTQVEPPTEPVEKVVTKQLSRKIILHLPSGDKVITQEAVATKTNDQWTVEPFEPYVVPTVDGYEASIKEVPACSLSEDELDEPTTFEVNYSPVESEKGDEKTETEGGQTEGDKSEVDQPTSGEDNEENTPPVKDDQPEEPDKSEPESPTIDQPATSEDDTDSNTKDQDKSDKNDESGSTSKEEPDRPNTGNNEEQKGSDEEVIVPPVENNNDQDSNLPDSKDDVDQNNNKEEASNNSEEDSNQNKTGNNQQPTLPGGMDSKTESVIDASNSGLPANQQENIPNLGAKLSQLQAPLELLNNDPQNVAETLPQTGNDSGKLTKLIGIAISAWVALSNLLIFNKKIN